LEHFLKKIKKRFGKSNLSLYICIRFSTEIGKRKEKTLPSRLTSGIFLKIFCRKICWKENRSYLCSPFGNEVLRDAEWIEDLEGGIALGRVEKRTVRRTANGWFAGYKRKEKFIDTRGE